MSTKSSTGFSARNLESDSLSMSELAQKGIRLRLDFVRRSLELSMTAAKFGSSRQQSERLRESCRAAALKGYTQIQYLLSMPAFARMDLSEFHPKLRELEHQLANLDGGSDSAPPAGPQLVTMRSVAPPDSKDPQPESLTPRETEVLRLIAEGSSTKQVAHTLGITFKTAACHRYRVMDKLGLHDSVRLVHYAIRKGLVVA